jgi:hypothetical protein
MFITTADNEIFLRTSTRPRTKPILVARLDAVGGVGVPLSWVGKTLLIHVAEKSLVQVLHRRVGKVSVVIVRDYSDEEFLRDNNVTGPSSLIEPL